MSNYCTELETLITDVLLPVYLEHYRLLGRASPVKEINSKLLQMQSKKKQVARLLERPKY